MAIKYPSLTPTSKDIPESQMAAIRKRLYKKWTPEQIKYETEPMPFNRPGVPKLAEELSYTEEMPVVGREGKTVPIRRQVMPSPEGLLEYMPGRPTSRLPSYVEYSGQEGITGPWGQTRAQNLNAALQNYIQGYQGKTVPWSQASAEAGIVGLPQPLGQDWLGQMKAIAEQKAEEAKSSNIVQVLNDEIIQAVKSGETITGEDVMNEGMMLGLDLNYDQAMSIFKSASDQAKRELEAQGPSG